MVPAPRLLVSDLMIFTTHRSIILKNNKALMTAHRNVLWHVIQIWVQKRSDHLSPWKASLWKEKLQIRKDDLQMLSLNSTGEDQNIPPWDVPLWHIILSYRQVRNSRFGKGSFYLKAKAGHKFPERKVLSSHQEEENILLTRKGGPCQDESVQTNLTKITLLIH